MRFLRLITMLAVFLAVGSVARAQEAVSARTGSHKGYVRLVFEWPDKPGYSVSKEGGRILVRFAKAGTLDTAGVSASDANVRKIETISKGTEPLQVAVSIPDGSRFRDFVVENKLIIDIYDPDGVQTDTAIPAEEKPAREAQAVKEAPPAPAPERKGDFSIRPAESGNTAPITDVESNIVPAPVFEPHAITLTSTTSTGMALFKRAGVLWMVLDNTDLTSAPEIVGPQKDKFPSLQKVELPGAIAYKLDLPDGLNVYAEGGNLSWRIDLTPKTQEETHPIAPSAEVKDGAAKLVWPLKDMRKIVTFADPLIGDQITAVTSPTAAQTTDARNFVNLQTLDSVVGLAIVPKSDDVTVEKTIADISAGRPKGLALSDAKDTKPEQIRQALQDEPKAEEAKPEEKPADETEEAKQLEKIGSEVKVDQTEPAPEPEAKEELPAATKEEISKAGEEKPTGNNIYNFARWEMGGIAALDNNMHVMMTEMSNKKEDARTEDLVTMAKLNIANHRGAEALGLMRIALMQVPELEDNVEFDALRGAALALSNKYDEAIIDLSRDGVKKYDDIKYWTTYALAGLEDWKQAIAVMPKTFDPIASYPKSIRMPMVLTFAEIALRGGDVPLANRILDILKPDLATLPLPYASYWNYLAGEAARQGGDPAKAIEYWEPLVKNGKDDLFRAKAGLSLTKLQLDQKKITAAEAINTLEGLRYAWRGDELETLINYRLGQMYVDNKDYLKGLTVLRNAATLSPGSDLNKDVNDYMVRSYRSVFSGDNLKHMSPLEAISLHEEFKDLLPPGEEGDKYVEELAERLVDADLLGRAASLLEYQVNNRLQGDKKAEIAIRLAAIRLLDGNPDGALRSLEIAQDTLDKLSGAKPEAPKPQDVKPEAGDATKPAEAPKQTADPEKQRQIYLLKARALSMKKETDKAMEILEGMRLDPDVNRLRTDIAWSAGRWDDAADALNDLITAEDISAKRPLTDYQRDIILNRAIALNLSGNRVALSNLRERYNAQMKDTTKGQMFEVVTRPRRPDMIGSRQAIDSMISEIDLFKGFVDNYAKVEAGKAGDAKAVPAAKESVPAEGKAPEPEAEKKVTELPEQAPEKPAE